MMDLAMAGHHDFRHSLRRVQPSPKSCHDLCPSFYRPPSNLDSKWFPPELFSPLSVLYLKHQMLFSALNSHVCRLFLTRRFPKAVSLKYLGFLAKRIPVSLNRLLLPLLLLLLFAETLRFNICAVILPVTEITLRGLQLDRRVSFPRSPETKCRFCFSSRCPLILQTAPQNDCQIP